MLENFSFSSSRSPPPLSLFALFGAPTFETASAGGEQYALLAAAFFFCFFFSGEPPSFLFGINFLPCAMVSSLRSAPRRMKSGSTNRALEQETPRDRTSPETSQRPTEAALVYSSLHQEARGWAISLR